MSFPVLLPNVPEAPGDGQGKFVSVSNAGF